MLGFPKIETLINERKLLFLRRLCSIPARSSSKQLFTYRLHSYFTMHASVNSGFIPDIISILDKYELLDYLKTFLACVFYPKKSMENDYLQSIEHIETCEWIVRNKTESTDRTIINIQSDLYSGSLLWETDQVYPHVLRMFSFLTRLCTLSSTNSDTYCRHCHLAMQDAVEHFFIDCKSLQLRRELFWNTVTDNCSIELDVT